MAGRSLLASIRIASAILAAEIAAVAREGVQVGVVVGGGNIFRGIALAAKNMDRVTGDHMGMLATVINSLALQDALEQMGQHTRVMSAIQMHQVAEPYIRRRAIRHLEKGPHRDLRGRHFEPLLFHRHRGHAARARNQGAGDRQSHQGGWRLRQRPDEAPRRRHVPAHRYTEVLTKSLGVMDATSIAMCRDNKLPIMVFNLNTHGNIMRMATGEPVGTLISERNISRP
jgi:uridylate kinase